VTPVRVLGISGSLRSGSHNTAILRHAGELFEAAGAQFELYQGLPSLPPFNVDDEVGAGPEPVARLRAAVGASDAVVFATPEYNSSMPGALKNAVDWLSRPRGASVLRAKRVAVMAATTGLFGALYAQTDLRRVLAATGARVVNREAAIGHVHTRFDATGRINDLHLQWDVQVAVDALLSQVQPPAPEELAG
jgi:chromate reductase